MYSKVLFLSRSKVSMDLSFFVKKIKIIIIIIIFFLENIISANEHKVDKITLSSAYFERTFNSIEGMTEYPLSSYGLYNRFIFKEFSVNDSLITRSFSALIGNSLTIFPYLIFSGPYHEFAHASRNHYFTGNDDYYYIVGLNGHRANNIYELSLKRIPFLGIGIPSIRYNYKSYTKYSERLVTGAAGLNAETLLAKNLSEKLYERGGSVPDLFFHMDGKVGPAIYSSLNWGDPIGIRDNYKSANKNISKRDFVNGYLFAFLASGSLYSLIYGNYNYIINNEKYIEMLNFNGFYLPDFYHYLNEKGLSMEAVFRYKINKNIDFSLSYETIYMGDKYNQLTPQLRFNYHDNFHIKSNLIIGFEKSIDFAGSLLVDMENDSIGSFLKYTYYNANTLYGERNIPFKSTPHEILIGLYYFLS